MGRNKKNVCPDSIASIDVKKMRDEKTHTLRIPIRNVLLLFTNPVVNFKLLHIMINSFLRSVVISSFLYGFALPSCWEGNQINHKILDLKENEGILNHIAYGLEDGHVGKKKYISL